MVTQNREFPFMKHHNLPSYISKGHWRSRSYYRKLNYCRATMNIFNIICVKFQVSTPSYRTRKLFERPTDIQRYWCCFKKKKNFAKTFIQSGQIRLKNQTLREWVEAVYRCHTHNTHKVHGVNSGFKLNCW